MITLGTKGLISTKLAVAIAAMTMAGGVWAANEENTLTANLTLTSACEVSATSTLTFDPREALDSAAFTTGDTGAEFQVACSADIVAPGIYTTGAREMAGGDSQSIPFNLSLVSGAVSDDLSSTMGTPSPISITQNGVLQTVPIYGRAANVWAAFDGDVYTTDITITVVY